MCLAQEPQRSDETFELCYFELCYLLAAVVRTLGLIWFTVHQILFMKKSHLTELQINE